MLLQSKRSLPLTVGKGGVGSAGCGVKHFWGGLALGKLMWNVGTAEAALAPEPCQGVPMGVSGCRAGSAQGSCGFVKKWNCIGGVGVEGFKINPHLHQGPLVLIWAPCRSVLAVHY